MNKAKRYGLILGFLTMFLGTLYQIGNCSALEDVIAYSKRGRSYAEQGKYDEAIKDYTRAIKIDPQSAQAFGFRGKAYQKLGKRKEAERDIKKAVELGWKGELQITPSTFPSFPPYTRKRGKMPSSLEHFRRAPRVYAKQYKGGETTRYTPPATRGGTKN